MDPKAEKLGTREGPEKQHPNAESMAKSAQTNQGGSISVEQSREETKLEKKAGGSMSDIKALMAAKHAIPSEDQNDPEKMGHHYEQMAAKVKQSGINLKAMDDSRKWFEEKDGKVIPKDYISFDTPLAAGAVRLGVFRLTDAESNGLESKAHKATQNLLDILPKGSMYHCNDPEHYHVTVQMISHPSDPRPDSFRKGGGLTHSLDHHWIPAPLPSNLQKEREIYTQIAEKFSPPRLKVHSIIFADSGAVILVFIDTSATIKMLRDALRDALPGANEKQPTILHVTLARILKAELAQSDIEKLVQKCREASDSLQGQEFMPSALWHVIEKTFTHINIDENCLKCSFKRS